MTYRNFDSYTSLQYADGSASLSLSGGYDVYSAFAPKGNSANASGNAFSEILSELATLGTKIDGTPTTLVLCAKATTGTADPVFASMNLVMRG